MKKNNSIYKNLKDSYELQDIVQIYSNKQKPQKSEAIIISKYKNNIKNRPILDIGCGAGRTTSFLKKETSQYYGFDYSFQMVKAAMADNKDVPLFQGDARTIPFKPDFFDFAIFSFMGLDDIPPNGRINTLMEIGRILRKEGIFVFSSNNRNYHQAGSQPKLYFTIHPRAMLRQLIQFIRSYYIYLIKRKQQVYTETYALLNEFSHGNAFLSYFIGKAEQKKQLAENGFELLEIYDSEGVKLELDSPDHHSYCIYYVARKS